MKRNGKQIEEVTTVIIQQNAIVVTETVMDDDRIPPHRRCPICWGENRGVGCAYNTNDPYSTGQDDWPPNVQRRYYRCTKTLREDRGPCGHTWVIGVKTEIVELP